MLLEALFVLPVSLSFKSRSLISLLLLGCALLSACDRQSAPNQQANAATSGEVPASAAKESENAPGYRVDRTHKGEPLPDFTFTDPQGNKATLAKFSGRPILVNLWATFCGPCIIEMPQLDQLTATYAKDRLAVITISQDSAGPEKVTAFFAKNHFASLEPWLDPENNFGFHYATGLLPTSVLYTADGREVARVTGAMDWESKDAQSLIEEAFNGG